MTERPLTKRELRWWLEADEVRHKVRRVLARACFWLHDQARILERPLNWQVRQARQWAMLGEDREELSDEDWARYWKDSKLRQSGVCISCGMPRDGDHPWLCVKCGGSDE